MKNINFISFSKSVAGGNVFYTSLAYLINKGAQNSILAGIKEKANAKNDII